MQKKLPYTNRFVYPGGKLGWEEEKLAVVEICVESIYY